MAQPVDLAQSTLSREILDLHEKKVFFDNFFTIYHAATIEGTKVAKDIVIICSVSKRK